MKQNIIKKIWRNRPLKYISEVIHNARYIPLKKYPNSKFRIWARNVLYLSWQE